MGSWKLRRTIGLAVSGHITLRLYIVMCVAGVAMLITSLYLQPVGIHATS